MSHSGLEGLPETAIARKARGAFFTPQALTDYICEWAIRSSEDRILEPSCGEAAFLLAAARRLDQLGASVGSDQLEGVELHRESAAAARVLLAEAGRRASVKVGDFFNVPGDRRFDAVIGNPPFVRYQGFTGTSRAAARRAALLGGVGLTALASSWAAFTVHSAEFLRPGGRLGLVLPAELLTVNYASEVRRYLMRSFGRVRLVLFTERVFPGVLEEVVLVMAEQAGAEGGTDHCELRQVTSAQDLAKELDPQPAQHLWHPQDVGAKWTPALLSSAALDAYSELVSGGSFTTLQSWGETTLGSVTGRNKYFALSPQQAAGLNLAHGELERLSPPGSRHLRGLSFSTAMWNQLGRDGARTLLFRPGTDKKTMSAGARRYLRLGEEEEVHTAYKCAIRKPWWQVPLVKPADLLLTYMNADTPRLTTNAAGVRHLNSVHGVYLAEEYRKLGRGLLPLASLNTMSLLGAELVGRAYGGGMLKLEPGEADLLPVPTVACVAAAGPSLRARRPAIRRALQHGDLLDAVRLVDEVLLHDVMKLGADQQAELMAARALMSARRLARGTSQPTGGS